MAKIIGVAVKPYNDVEFTADGNLRLVYDAEAVGQHARQRITFFLGEWFLDRSIGVDWFGRAFGRQGEKIAAVADGMLKREILDTPGVTEIVEYDSAFDKASRGHKVNVCEVETEFGDPIII